MEEKIIDQFPSAFPLILEATKASGFTMASDPLTCSLLRTLAATKRAGNFLEFGTGTGLSTCWILDGMDEDSTLTTIDNDPVFQNIAGAHLANDGRLRIELIDGGKWIDENKHLRFDYVFADSWHGKFLMLDEVLGMLNKGGLYIIDDMINQPNWPEGHQEKVDHLLDYLDLRNDLFLTKQHWASGIIIATKK